MNKNIYYVVPLIVVGAWYVLVVLNFINPLFLPSPYKVLVSLLFLLKTGEFWKDIGFTLYRATAGFFIACLFGIPIGLLMGYSHKIYSSLEFLVEFARSVPAIALYPLFLLAFGVGNGSKIAITAFGAGLIITINSMYGVHLGKVLRVKAAKSLNIKSFQLFKKVIFPEALPHIFGGMRLATSISLILVIAAEMFIGTTYGLGRRIIDFQLVYKIPEMYAVVIITGILGFVINKLFFKIENKVVHWKGQ